ncbi:5'-nucleotidase C-terminal domain-containing protein [Maribacter sp. MMG018]|uniref:5'-nucleotidase C-terminal domain-containing protein n=1 Tax=Maribacter sp. MMG018 TaxID=2822688 RepID=UPI001B36205D|nr:5'-nucleotidase [Maribacter sp. MMG018]MBQ4914906.1 5'-nucleotidase C-terminal domain-containing protein [Maribacter sp. MMG018]
MAKLKHFSYLKIKHFVIITTIGLVGSCKQSPQTLTDIAAKQIVVDSTYHSVEEISNFVKPYHDHVNSVLDSTLAYAPHKITKTDGEYNTSAGNLMADIVLLQASPVFKKRTGKDIDFVLLNHGGIRSVISKGNVSARTAYEVMPFENTMAVASLKGSSILDMVSYLIKSKRPHPVAGIQIVLNADNTLNSLKIQGKPFDKNKTYYVATSNYLITGGDNMGFFKDADEIIEIDYKIRNAMIDYFTKVDTITAKVDDRYYKLD